MEQFLEGPLLAGKSLMGNQSQSGQSENQRQVSGTGSEYVLSARTGRSLTPYSRYRNSRFTLKAARRPIHTPRPLLPLAWWAVSGGNATDIGCSAA